MRHRPSWEANQFYASKEIPQILLKPIVNHHIHKCPHLSLTWASSIQSKPPHPTSWKSILILSHHLRLGLPVVSFPQDFPTKRKLCLINLSCTNNLFSFCISLSALSIICPSHNPTAISSTQTLQGTLPTLTATCTHFSIFQSHRLLYIFHQLTDILRSYDQQFKHVTYSFVYMYIITIYKMLL